MNDSGDEIDGMNTETFGDGMAGKHYRDPSLR